MIEYIKPAVNPFRKVDSLVPSHTRITKNSPTVKVLVYYQGIVLFQTVRAFISDVSGISNGVPYVAGELVIEMIGHPEYIDYNLNAAGELIVNAPDAEKYSINEEGYLIYTE